MSSAVPDGPEESNEPDRIDALLTTALADQARERRMLVDTVFGAKAALVKAEEEMTALKEAVVRRDETLLEAIAKSQEAAAKSNESLIEAITATVQEALKARPKISPPRDAGLTLRIEAIEDGILQLAQRIAELPSLIRKEMEELSARVLSDFEELSAQLRRDLEVSAVAIGERIGEESGSLLADIREDQVEVVQTLAAMSDTTTGDLKQAINRSQQELMERVASASRDAMEAGASSVEQMVEHLTGYLQARDEQLYRARDQRLVELFQQLSDTIGRTTKRKLGKIIEAEGGSPPKPISPPMPPVKAPPPLSIPRTARPLPSEPTQAIRPPFAPPGDAGPAQPGPGRGGPDPAFMFNEPPSRPFDTPGYRPEDESFESPAAPFDGEEDPFESREQGFFSRGDPRPVRPGTPFGGTESPGGLPDPSLNQALGNPLSRAELARDYLIDTPSDAFPEEPPGRPGGRAGRKPMTGLDPEPPVKRRSSRTPKPPAAPRGRRKA
ncbi:MAG TPA: hypothetical protein VHJ78_01295 [Actinomycetota bacterium]|nr:hypothetical protein [Actinomycetota bacterium]